MEVYPSAQQARSNIMSSFLTRRPQIRINEQYSGEDYKLVELTPAPGQSILLENASGLEVRILSKPANLKLVDCSRLVVSLHLGCVSSVDMLRCQSVRLKSTAHDGSWMVSVEHSEAIDVEIPTGDAKLMSIASRQVNVCDQVIISGEEYGEVLVYWDKSDGKWKVGPLLRDQQRGGVPIFSP